MTGKLHEACGVVGVVAEEAARLAFFGLFALQHRGQESAGIATLDTGSIHLHKDVGLVSQVFRGENFSTLAGNIAIGHTRYSTTGKSSARNAQPFLIDTQFGPLALGHNGNIANAPALRKQLLGRGLGLMTGSDSELLAMMLAGTPGKTWTERIAQAMKFWIGAYSLVLLTREGVFAVRDPWGYRPLAWGRIDSGGWAVASETSALRVMGCSDFEEIPPGTILHFNERDPVECTRVEIDAPHAACSFEYVYFSRPDSVWNGKNIHAVRRRLGELLAEEAPASADLVIPVPDSSIAAAIGYAQRSGIPFGEGLVKNRYIGRTFIEPTKALRRQGVALKFSPLKETLEGARIVLVDDSIVRGTTTAPIVALCRNAGAREVHLRIASPRILHPCYMGVDMGTEHDLIAVGREPEEIAKMVGADSLAYLSIEGLSRAIGIDGVCRACFDGNYHIPVDENFTKNCFEGFGKGTV
ncbi:MAG: amidophosphoribosyltransferase [Rectinema sp.]